MNSIVPEYLKVSNVGAPRGKTKALVGISSRVPRTKCGVRLDQKYGFSVGYELKIPSRWGVQLQST